MSDQAAREAGPARLPRLTPFHLNPTQRELYDTILNSRRATKPYSDGRLPGPFSAMLLSPPVGHAMQALGSAIRFDGCLPPRTREMAILTVASACSSDYEWSRHSRIALALGVADAQLAAIRAFEDLPPATDPLEQLAVRIARKLLKDGDLSDVDFVEARSGLGDDGVFELSTIVGYYRLIALQLRLFRVATEDAAAPNGG